MIQIKALTYCCLSSTSLVCLTSKWTNRPQTWWRHSLLRKHYLIKMMPRPYFNLLILLHFLNFLIYLLNFGADFKIWHCKNRLLYSSSAISQCYIAQESWGYLDWLAVIFFVESFHEGSRYISTLISFLLWTQCTCPRNLRTLSRPLALPLCRIYNHYPKSIYSQRRHKYYHNCHIS